PARSYASGGETTPGPSSTTTSLASCCPEWPTPTYSRSSPTSSVNVRLSAPQSAKEPTGLRHQKHVGGRGSLPSANFGHSPPVTPSSSTTTPRRRRSASAPTTGRPNGETSGDGLNEPQLLNDDERR